MTNPNNGCAECEERTICLTEEIEPDLSDLRIDITDPQQAPAMAKLFPEESADRPVFLPDVTGFSLFQAASAYAAAGWFVLPVAPGTKNPGSVVGSGWQSKSTRNPDEIASWWNANPAYGIALHVGRSGAVAFDLDYGSLAAISESGHADIAEALAAAGGINGTRADGDRGHYLFACEVNEFSNSSGGFERWGEVRGANGVIIAPPTLHPDADTKGGCYRQIRAGALTPLPDVLRAVLSDAGDSVEPLSCVELDNFLQGNSAAGSCGHTSCIHTPKGQVHKFAARTAGGASRHDVMCFDVLPWAFREAIAGCYPARSAFEALRAVWQKAFTAADPRWRRVQLDDEFLRMASWAAAQAAADPGTVHDDAQLRSEDSPKLWRATALRPGSPPSWLAQGRLPRAAISLLVGDEGIGKSLLWVWIAAAITTGKPRFEFGIPAREPARAIVVVTEDDWSTAVRPRLEASGADLDMIDVICTEPDGSGAPTFPRDLHLIRDAAEPALVVVDAWLDTVPASLKVRDPQDARKALHPWKEVAQTTGAAVLLITHTNRDKSADARDRYGITGELRKKARMALYAQADAERRLIVGPEKMNSARPLPASKFDIESVQWFPATHDHDGTVPVLRYIGESDRTARQHVRDAVTKGPAGDEGDDLRELWLYQYLADAADAGVTVRPKEAETAARNNEGISRTTLYRNFHALAKAGLVQAINSGTFPKSTTWQIVNSQEADGTTGDGGTTA